MFPVGIASGGCTRPPPSNLRRPLSVQERKLSQASAKVAEDRFASGPAPSRSQFSTHAGKPRQQVLKVGSALEAVAI